MNTMYIGQHNNERIYVYLQNNKQKTIDYNLPKLDQGVTTFVKKFVGNVGMLRLESLQQNLMYTAMVLFFWSC